MIVTIALGLLVLFVILACAHLICAQCDPDDLRKMGIGR